MVGGQTAKKRVHAVNRNINLAQYRNDSKDLLFQEELYINQATEELIIFIWLYLNKMTIGNKRGV